MVDTVKDMSAALLAMKAGLQGDAKTSSMRIKLMAPINSDPGLAVNGWVGVYADQLLLGPRAIGTGSRKWKMDPRIRLVVQAVDQRDPEVAYLKLEGYIKAVLDAVLANPTLASVVDALESMTIEYTFQEDDRATLHFLAALVTMDFTGTTN